MMFGSLKMAEIIKSSQLQLVWSSLNLWCKVLGLWFLVKICNSHSSIRKILPVITKPLNSRLPGIKINIFNFSTFKIHNVRYGSVTVFLNSFLKFFIWNYEGVHPLWKGIFEKQTRKATGLKSQQVNCWEIRRLIR